MGMNSDVELQAIEKKYLRPSLSSRIVVGAITMPNGELRLIENMIQFAIWQDIKGVSHRAHPFLNGQLLYANRESMG